MAGKQFLILFVVILAVQFMYAQTSTGFEKGQIIPNVVCQIAPDQSYALYLPEAYSPEKKWPILYLFEPAARSMIPMKRFQETAEKYGYILLCSNNSRNGPSRVIINAIKAVWIDSHKRLSIDPKRIYAGGFSGGSRAATRFHYMTRGSCAGIIACGAGLSLVVKTAQLKPADYFGIVGTGDFNYSEMADLVKELQQEKIYHRLLVFDGDHRWPSADICQRAIEWMEIRAMKRHSRTRDHKLAQVLFDKELEISGKLESEQKYAQAVENQRSALALFTGLVDTTRIESKLKDLEKSKGYKKFLKSEKQRNKKEKMLLSDFFKASAQIRHSSFNNMPSSKILHKLQLNRLAKMLNSDDRLERGLGVRITGTIRINANREAGKYMQQKDYKRAAIYYEILTAINDRDANSFYNLACVFSLEGKKNRALKALEKAIGNGFRNRRYIEQDKDLSSLRNEEKYKALLSRIEAK